jgi:hypothetical protein
MRNALRRKPSASMVVSVTALIFALTGTAAAAGGLLNGNKFDGDKLIKTDSLSGDRLRYHTLSARQVDVSKLGKVPIATNADRSGYANHSAYADHAALADNATSATNAANATTLNGQSAGSYLTTANRIGTNGVFKMSGTASGNTATMFTVGPFTVTMTCTKTGAGTTLSESGTSTEANSDINGTFVPTAGTPQTLVEGQITTANTSPQTTKNENIDFEAPSGAQAVLIGATGINSLGTDCWANWTGLH